ncbi:MAG: patatin-like phospholipase family protein [Capsulimonadales bacterium]|nr:patatin-like phospholipase family protein [Capsulimonadales bacterium]
MRSTLALLLLLAGFLCPIRPGRAQEAVARKRIGLVLSGGSSYGFAHLGVLQWMEENRIPIDYLAGTSMGALIGGLYATGMTVPEMKAQLSRIDWDDLFRSSTPHRLRTFRRKEDAREFQNNLEFGRGFTSQTGLDSVYPVSILLSRLTLPYPDEISFDDLPIPFRCTSVELNEGRIVRFSSGSLGQAMRSSMAIPLVFTTVDANRRSYVDGAVFENLPTATMVPGPDRPATWRPEVVVTVRLKGESDESAEATGDKSEPPGDKPPQSVSTGIRRDPTPSNLFDVIGRLIAAVTNENVERSIALVDRFPELSHIPLVARIGNFSVEDFARWRELAAIGYAEAERNRAAFLPFQLTPADWEAYVATKGSRRRLSVTPTRVTIIPQDPSRPFDPRLNSYLLTFLRKYAGRTFTIRPDASSDDDTRELIRDLDYLTGTGIFESISYNRTTLGGQPALAIRPKEKPYGPPYFLANLSIDSGNTDNVQTVFHVRANFIGRGLDASDEYRTDLRLGSRRELSWEWYRPLPFRSVFVLPSAYTRRWERGISVPTVPSTTFATDETAVGLDLGVDLGRFSQVRVGQRFGNREYTPRAIPGLSDAQGTISTTTFRYVYDGQDDPIIPRSGLYSHVRGEWYQRAPDSGRGYGQFSAENWFVFPISRMETVQTIVNFGEQTNGRAPLAERFALGGPFRLTAHFNGELRGERYRFGSVGYVRRLTPRSALLGGALHLGAWYEDGQVFSVGDRTRRRDLHLSAFTPTLVGPVAIGLSVGDAGKKRFYVRFGQLY